MRTTHYLLVAIAVGVSIAAIGGYGYRNWLSVLIGAAIVVLAAAVLRRWLKRQPHPRWDKFREFIRPQAYSAQTVIDRSETTLRQHGLASDAEIRRHGGEGAVLELAPVVRPSLARRGTVDVQEVALELCTVGRLKVWSSIEQVVLYFAGPRRGKALALDTPVPTPSGWTTMGEIRDGDELYDEAGRKCRVVRAHPVRYERPCYEVEFSDHSVIVADAEHLWCVETRKSRQGEGAEKVMTTEELIPRVRIGSDRRANYSIPVSEPLAAPDASLPIPPYTLGAWLGDGANRGGLITLGTSKEPVAAAIRADGYELTEQLSSRRGNCTAYNVTGLIGQLRAANLRHNKHIPAAYFRASEAQRRALLAGLLDTDGWCQPSGNVCFCSTQKQLAVDFRTLLGTLGYVSTIRSRPARLYDLDCGTAWYVTFCPDRPVFRLARKAERQSTHHKASNKRRFIVDIRPVQSVPVRCITVDSPSSLFLVGDQCIATHNSGWLDCRVVDFPGSVVTTSTRIDVFTATHRARSTRGRVQVFNAGGFPGVDDVAVTFNPLTGCEESEIATQRAEDMIPESTGEEERWQSLARGALASLMHAAALDGRDMDTVQRWVAAPGKHQDEVIRLLRRSTSGGVMEDARQFFECNDKTRSSITTSVMPALRWLQSKTARLAAGLDGASGQPLDAASLVTSVSTLYVLGRRAGHTYPLMSALTGYVARAARERAAEMPAGRCDPPLGLLLDEAGDLRPPLPDWTRDMGGSGITIAACFQSYAQMVGAWGKEGAAIILNNAGPIMLGGGTKDPDDLAVWRDLAGDRDDRTTTTDAQGKVTAAAMRSVPVLPPSQLASQARMEVVLFHGEMRPALGRTTMLWERDPSIATPTPSPVEEEAATPVVEVPRVWRRTSPPRPRRVPVEEVVADV